MKNLMSKIVMAAVSLLVAATLSFAIEVKTTAPVSPVDPAKAAAEKTKVDVKGTAGKVKADSKAAAADTKAAAKGAAADTKAAAKGALVDINTATEAELKKIPGVGDAYAAKIIAGRPYANKSQLKSRKIVPSDVYDKIAPLIIAKAVKK